MSQLDLFPEAETPQPPTPEEVHQWAADVAKAGIDPDQPTPQELREQQTAIIRDEDTAGEQLGRPKTSLEDVAIEPDPETVAEAEAFRESIRAKRQEVQSRPQPDHSLDTPRYWHGRGK